MLSGHDPYQGMAIGSMISYKMHSGDKQVPFPAYLSETKNHIVRGLLNLALHCTRADRRDRPPIDEVIEMIQDILSG